MDSSVGEKDRFYQRMPAYPPQQNNVAGGDSARKRHTNQFEDPASRQKNFSRSASQAPPQGNRFGAGGPQLLQNEANKCISEIREELQILENPYNQSSDIQNLIHSRRLLNEEVNKLESHMNSDRIDVSDSRSSIRILKCVLLPKPRAGNNVVGRLLGVRGATLKAICQQYKCHISIAGTGSTRKTPKEERELLQSGDPQYSHLACPLHVEISTVGQPHSAYARFSQFLTLMHKLVTTHERFEHDSIVFDESPRERKNEDFGEDRQKTAEPPQLDHETEVQPQDENVQPIIGDYPAFEEEN